MPSRALPKTEMEIQSQLVAGGLPERHYFDLKRELPPSSRRANKDLAVDLASLAIDGGAILVGVDEENDALHPLELSGLKERIDQIARNGVDEPLYVQVDEIPSIQQPGLGYALITIPPSPAAPHMVDGRYRGRGDTTNTILSDGEVARLHALRREREHSIRDLLEQEVVRDPTGDNFRTQSHLFIIGVPVLGRQELLHKAIKDVGWEQWLRNEILSGAACRSGGTTWSPDLYSGFTTISRRAEGYSIHSLDLGADRQLRHDASESGLIELEIGEDGSIRLFCGRASAEIGDHKKVVFEELIVGLSKRVILTAKSVADAAGYYGSWDFAVAITNLHGALSFELTRHGGGTPYSGVEYRSSARTTYQQLSEDPNSVVNALVSLLGRGLRREFRAEDLSF